MSAHRLRAATRLLRDRAEAATPGPWRDPDDPTPHIGDFGWYVAGCPAGETEASPQGYLDANYIATMHPLVGLALADLLDEVAEHVPECRDLCGRGACGIVTTALGVADAILGSAS